MQVHVGFTFHLENACWLPVILDLAQLHTWTTFRPTQYFVTLSLLLGLLFKGYLYLPALCQKTFLGLPHQHLSNTDQYYAQKEIQSIHYAHVHLRLVKLFVYNLRTKHYMEVKLTSIDFSRQVATDSRSLYLQTLGNQLINLFTIHYVHVC